ncbi:MAG: hypothetical protein GY756_14210 [bacterium]|nr:hypothetical protein [bacterium]
MNHKENINTRWATKVELVTELPEKEIKKNKIQLDREKVQKDYIENNVSEKVVLNMETNNIDQYINSVYSKLKSKIEELEVLENEFCEKQPGDLKLTTEKFQEVKTNVTISKSSLDSYRDVIDNINKNVLSSIRKIDNSNEAEKEAMIAIKGILNNINIELDKADFQIQRIKAINESN